MRHLPPGVALSEQLDARTITVTSGPPAARPGRALLSLAAGLAVVALSLWLLLRDPLSTVGALSMLAGFLGAGALFIRALTALAPRDTTTQTIQLTATHLVLPGTPPILLEALASVICETGGVRLTWKGDLHRIERLPDDAARWLVAVIQQAAARRQAAPARPVPAALQALRDRP